MAQGIHNFTVQEAQNVQLGQCITAHLDDTNHYVPANKDVVIAIQVIQDCTFAALEAQDPYSCMDTTATNDNSWQATNRSGTGDKIAVTTTFVAGLVLYGRWTKVDLSAGVVNLYIGT
tara:strand:+ start:631 stop:984 length:354 start_codon:yes stop_codon:yes gene_type:complete